jgi:hypothetical protein
LTSQFGRRAVSENCPNSEIGLPGPRLQFRRLVLKLLTFSRLDEGEFKKADVRENIESILTGL